MRKYKGNIRPTEDMAVWNADHQEKKRDTVRVLTEHQIKRQGIQKPEHVKQLESFNAFLDAMRERKTDDNA